MKSEYKACFLVGDITDCCFFCFPCFGNQARLNIGHVHRQMHSEKTARLAGMQDGRQVASETMQLIRLIIVNVVLHCLFFI